MTEKIGKPVNFSLVLPPRGTQEAREFWKGQLGMLTGMPSSQLSDRSLHGYLSFTLGELVPGHDLSLITRLVDEEAGIRQRAAILAEIALNAGPVFFSFGRNAPAYLSFLQTLQIERELPTNMRSLMVGVFPQGVIEYAAITSHVFPEATLHALDLQGGRNVEYAQSAGVEFTRGNACALPYEDNSMDLVHFDLLLHQLLRSENSRKMSPKLSQQENNAIIAEWFDSIALAIKEAYRVLKPGGVLTIIEPLLPSFIQVRLASLPEAERVRVGSSLSIAYLQSIDEALIEAGFSGIEANSPAVFIHPDGFERYIGYGNFAPIPRDEVTQSQVSLMFSAQKPR